MMHVSFSESLILVISNQHVLLYWAKIKKKEEDYSIEALASGNFLSLNLTTLKFDSKYLNYYSPNFY
jgi:hypothetical protein